MSFEYTITVKDVYGTDTPEIPEGWELTGEFRPWKERESFFNAALTVQVDAGDNGPYFTPRLILRRKKVRKVIFTEIRQNSQPIKGEWFLDSSGRYGQWNTNAWRGDVFHPTTIYRREEVEE